MRSLRRFIGFEKGVAGGRSGRRDEAEKNDGGPSTLGPPPSTIDVFRRQGWSPLRVLSLCFLSLFLSRIRVVSCSSASVKKHVRRSNVESGKRERKRAEKRESKQRRVLSIDDDDEDDG